MRTPETVDSAICLRRGQTPPRPACQEPETAAVESQPADTVVLPSASANQAEPVSSLIRDRVDPVLTGESPLEQLVRPGRPARLRVELDRASFWIAVQRLPDGPRADQLRLLDQWAVLIDHAARNALPSDILLLESHWGTTDLAPGYFALRSRARLEVRLANLDGDPQSRQLLASLFDQEFFPSLQIRREETSIRQLGPADPPYATSLTPSSSVV